MSPGWCASAGWPRPGSRWRRWRRWSATSRRPRPAHPRRARTRSWPISGRPSPPSVEQSRDGDIGGFLGAQLGSGDPAAGYLAYCGTLAGCAVILITTGLVSAAIAPAVIDGDQIAARSLAYMLGQWPAAVAATGCTVLVVGLRPRLAGLAWVPLVASGALALLGNLLDVPRRIQRLGFFQHVPDIAVPAPGIGALLVLLALGAALCLLGLLGATRREIVTG
jgi:ABC-2 type transport system permease protein